MMRKTFLFFVLLYFTAATTSAQKIGSIDFDSIYSAIGDKTSEFFYQTLMDRYYSNDTALNVNDYLHLYYGFTAQPKYNPYGVNHLEDTVRYMMREDKLEQVRGVVDRILQKDPFNLDMIYKVYLSYKRMDKPEEAEIWRRKYVAVIQAIVYSGDGLSPEKAFVVNAVRDEYEVLASSGLEPLEQSLSGNCDIIKIKKNPYGINEIYFNVEKPMEFLSKQFKR